MMSSSGGIIRGAFEHHLMAPLADADVFELLTAASECTCTCIADDGWPSGMVMSFLHARDALWLTTIRGRRQERSMQRDGRVSIVISSAGTALFGRRMIAIRGNAVEVKEPLLAHTILRELSAKLAPANVERFLSMLLGPKRVLFRVEWVSTEYSHDSRRQRGL